MFASTISYVLEPFVQSPTLGFIAIVIFGLLVGSFLNVVIHRVPKMLEAQWAHDVAQYNAQDSAEDASPESKSHQRYNLITPGSACPHCGHKIRSWENIPVVSWLILRGKCSNCAAKISSRYPLIELLTGVLAGIAAWHFGASIQLDRKSVV